MRWTGSSSIYDYRKLKTRLVHLICQTSLLSLACLKRAQNTYISLQLGKIIEHKLYFMMKCLTTSPNLLDTVLKAKNRMLSGYRVAVTVSIVSPHDRVTNWETQPSITREYRKHTTSPGKKPDSKFKVQFLLNAYHFGTTIRLKNPKLGTTLYFKTASTVSPLMFSYAPHLLTSRPDPQKAAPGLHSQGP